MKNFYKNVAEHTSFHFVIETWDIFDMFPSTFNYCNMGYVSEHTGGVGPVVQQCSVKIINIPGNGNTVIEGGYPEAHIYPHKHVINLQMQIQILRKIQIQILRHENTNIDGNGIKSFI